MNLLGHFHTVNKHRYEVFKLCCKCGIPMQGLLHDLSKYSFTEFVPGVKFWTGKASPRSKREKFMVIPKLGFTTKAEINIISNIGQTISKESVFNQLKCP